MINAPRILGYGTALPNESMSSAEFATIAARLNACEPREAAVLHAVAARSGIDRRHSVLIRRNPVSNPVRLPIYEDAPSPPGTAARMAVYAQEAGALAALAATRALAAAALDGPAITHLVTASCTGFFAPGLELQLLEKLSLPVGVERVHLGFMGCHAALNGCRVARGLACGQPNARVLVVCVELCTLHYQAGLERDALVPNMLFGDGAAAMVIGAEEGEGLRIVDTASQIVRESAAAMTWCITDTGFKMTLDASVPRLIAGHLRPIVEAFLERNQLGISEVKSWAIHPGGPKILEGALEALGLPEGAGACSRAVLRKHGNMSSPTIIFILSELLQRGPVVALAFGPGLSVELVLFR